MPSGIAAPVPGRRGTPTELGALPLTGRSSSPTARSRAANASTDAPASPRRRRRDSTTLSESLASASRGALRAPPAGGAPSRTAGQHSVQRIERGASGTPLLGRHSPGPSRGEALPRPPASPASTSSTGQGPVDAASPSLPAGRGSGRKAGSGRDSALAVVSRAEFGNGGSRSGDPATRGSSRSR